MWPHKVLVQVTAQSGIYLAIIDKMHQVLWFLVKILGMGGIGNRVWKASGGGGESDFARLYVTG